MGEIDTAVVAEKQKSAYVNGRWEHLKSTVVITAYLTFVVHLVVERVHMSRPAGSESSESLY